MKRLLWITALLLGVATILDQRSAFGRDNPQNNNRNTHNPGRAGNAIQAPRTGQTGNQGGGAHAVQNQVRNQIQIQQHNQQQLRQNFNQQAIQHHNQVNQQINQNRNLINQQLNNAHHQVQRNQLQQLQQQQNQLNQAQHRIQQSNQNPVLNQNPLLNQRQNQLNQNLQNFGQHNNRPAGTGFPRNTNPNSGFANELQQGTTSNLTMKPPINPNSDNRNQNQIRNQIQQQIQQRQHQIQQHQQQNQASGNRNPNQILNQNLNPGLNQNLNQQLNADRFRNQGQQGDRGPRDNQVQHSNRNNWNRALNPQQLQQVQQHHLQNQTAGLNKLAHYKHKVVGGGGFTPLYATGHNHHHIGNAQQHYISNKLNFGRGQIYLGRPNYVPSYNHHPHWYKGYWNLYGNNYGGYGWNSGYPYGYGSYAYLPYFWGLGGWGLGSLAYGCGYTHYYNPYYVVTPTTIVYDYAQPIPVAYNTQVVSVDPNEGATTDQILASAIAAFKLNDYDQALDIVNSGITRNSDDAVLHEFRSLVLFAKGDYQQSAATIHSVLAVGPGWNWTTLSGMYSDVGIYTLQLRALEAAVKANPDDAASRFLLAYHYMSDGYPDAATTQFQRVVALVPNDQVSANLLKMLTAQQPPAAANAPQATPEPGIDLPSPADTTPATPVDPAAIVGDWNASRDDGSTFNLKISGEDKFTWTYTPKDQAPQSFDGTYKLEGNVIALERDGGGSMVAEITNNDGTRFNFKMVGAPDEDPGLNFAR